MRLRLRLRGKTRIEMKMKCCLLGCSWEEGESSGYPCFLVLGGGGGLDLREV